MEEAEILQWVLTAALLVGGGVLLFQARKRWQWQKAFTAATPVDARQTSELPSGTDVRLTGVAHPPPAGPLKAPYSEKECVYFRTKVEERRLDSRGSAGRGGRRGRSRWRSRGGEKSHDPFYAGDEEEGRVEIRPDEADATGLRRTVHRRHLGGAGLNVSLGNLQVGAGGDIRVSEWIIPAGETVHAAGRLESAGDGTHRLCSGTTPAVVTTVPPEKFAASRRRRAFLMGALAVVLLVAGASGPVWIPGVMD